MRDRQTGRAGAGDLAFELGHFDERGRDVEDRLVADLPHVDVEGVSHRPAAVVVGAECGIRVVLPLEKILREPPVRLSALDHVRAWRKRRLADFYGGGRLSNFNPLHAEDADELGRLRHLALCRNHVPERRGRAPLFH